MSSEPTSTDDRTDDAQTTLTDDGWSRPETASEDAAGGSPDEPTNQGRPPEQEFTYCSTCVRDRLQHRKLVLFESRLRAFAEWLEEQGKEPEQKTGMAAASVANTIKRIDRIFRVLWDRHGREVLDLTHELADAYNEWLADDELVKADGEPYAPATKDKDNEALAKYFEWRAEVHDGQRWEPQYEFEDPGRRPPDALTKAERGRLRDVVLEWKTIPAYNDLSPAQRDRWKEYIAMRLGKPKSAVEPADWDRINLDWKVPSLLWVALDTGLRPIEVERSTMDWLRLDKEALYIPKTDSAKNRDHWECALLPETVEICEKWLAQRSHRVNYDGTDAIWLTRENNSYASKSLNYLFDNLLEAAGIDRDNRKLSWYSIRHSVGDHLTSEGGLQQAREQLRHKSILSTLKYQNPTVADRQDSLNRMG